MPYTAADVRAREALARILICALPKAGKTTSSVLTSPKPVFVFNTDGKGALDPVMLMGGEFEAEDITDHASFNRALAYLRANQARYVDPANGICGTAIFDNISTFSARVLEELKKTIKDGRQLYPELTQIMTSVMRALIALPMHVVVLGHLKQGEKLSGEATKFLSVPGTGGTAISALMQDWIGLDVTIEAETSAVKREFLLAPQGAWQAAVRSVKNIERIPADITYFLELIKMQRAPAVEATPDAEEPEADAAVEEEAPEEAAAEEEQQPEPPKVRVPVRSPVRAPVRNGSARVK